MTIKDFRELDVYMRARAGAKRIFALTRKFPAEERFNLTAQILKSSRSVLANIAEAWRKRLHYPASFVSKLTDADAESGETIVWIDLAWDNRYITQGIPWRSPMSTSTSAASS